MFTSIRGGGYNNNSNNNNNNNRMMMMNNQQLEQSEYDKLSYMERYKLYLQHNTQKARLMETVIQAVGFLMPSRFGDSELWSETGYACSHLLSLLNDSLLASFKEQIPYSGMVNNNDINNNFSLNNNNNNNNNIQGIYDNQSQLIIETERDTILSKLRIIITVIHHLEVIAEKVALKYGTGMEDNLILFIECIKTLSRLYILYHRQDLMIQGGKYIHPSILIASARDYQRNVMEMERCELQQKQREEEIQQRRLNGNDNNKCIFEKRTTYRGKRMGRSFQFCLEKLNSTGPKTTTILRKDPFLDAFQENKNQQQKDDDDNDDDEEEEKELISNNNNDNDVDDEVIICDNNEGDQGYEEEKQSYPCCQGQDNENENTIQIEKETITSTTTITSTVSSSSSNDIELLDTNNNNTITAKTGQSSDLREKRLLIAGEILYIIRPLVTSWFLCHKKRQPNGRRDPKYEKVSFIISAILDYASYIFTTSAIEIRLENKKRPLSTLEVQELRRRKFSWGLYLLREPVFSVITRPILLEFINSFKWMPLFGRLAEYCTQLILYLQKHHFYTSGS